MHRAHSLSSQLFPYCLWEPAHSLWARVNRDYRTPMIRGLAMFWITRPSPDPLAADPNLAAKYHRGTIPLQDFFWPTPKISVTQPKTLFPVRIIPPKRGFKAAMLLPSPATGWPESTLSLRAFFHIGDCRSGTYAPPPNDRATNPKVGGPETAKVRFSAEPTNSGELILLPTLQRGDRCTAREYPPGASAPCEPGDDTAGCQACA